MAATVLSDAWRLRRQRKLDAVEIPDCDVTVTDELLGKGGFGAVYLADYNGRNAAAKVSGCTIVSCPRAQQLVILRCCVNTTVFPSAIYTCSSTTHAYTRRPERDIPVMT